MKMNRIGTSDLYASEIGFGCMSLGKDEAAASRLLDEAIDRGINFFDTADLYDHGMNETIVGKALKQKRHNVIIATKVGNRWNEDKEGWQWDPSRAYIKEAVKHSLKRLQTDYIDLYQLHGGTTDDNIDETIAAFEELSREGWIRHYGISSIRPNVIREYVERSNIVSVLTQYSLLDRRPEEEILPLLEANGISAIVRGPVAKGLLTGHANLQSIDEPYLDYDIDALKKTLENLRTANAPVRTPGQMAIRYTLAHPAVATVIAGASRLEQLRENSASAQTPPLALEELETLREMTKANIYTSHR